MRHVFRRTLCLIMALLLLPVCPARADTPAITIGNAPSTAFRDPYTLELLNKGAGLKAVCGQHTYLFPKLVKENLARQYVAQAEAVFALLAGYGGTDRPLTIHVVAAAHPLRVDGDTLYISLSAFRSMDYVTGLTQLWFGVHVVHGLLYAVSCDIAAQLGVAVEAVPGIDAALSAFAGSNIVYTDMNYACFVAPYASPEMQLNVKALARDFYATLTPQERTALLTDYSNEAFYLRLNEYLISRGLTPWGNESIWGLSFHSGGPSIAVGWESDYASFAVATGYRDIYGAYWYDRWERPLASSYADLLYWAEYFEGMMSWLMERFGPYITFRKPLIVFDSERVGVLAPYEAHYTAGYYLHREHTIFTGCCAVVGHEFIHALISPEGVNMNMNEVIAYTYSIALLPEPWNIELEIIAEDYASRSNPLHESYDPRWSEILLQAHRALGHWPDYGNQEDMMVLIDLVTCLRGHANDANLHADYSAQYDMKAAKISFWRYLMRTYGEEAALRAALSDDPETLLGRSWATLTEDWIAWLNETYAAPQ